MDDKETFGGPSNPLAEAVEIIEKLLAFCTKHNLKREAYSIALGEELPPPPKRKPGAPLKRVPSYYRLLAFLLALRTRERPERRGDRAAVARAVARAEAEVRTGSTVLSREEKKIVGKRVLQIQNDLSSLMAEQIVIAAYCVRRLDAGETPETIKATLEAAMDGGGEAERKIFEAVLDILGPRLINSREDSPLFMRTS